jgi:hypothetical protein
VEKYRIIPEILLTEAVDDTLKVYSTESIKFDIEKIVKDLLDESAKGEHRKRSKLSKDVKVTETSYISEVIVDVKDDEITIDSKDEFSLPNVAVGAGRK